MAQLVVQNAHHTETWYNWKWTMHSTCAHDIQTILGAIADTIETGLLDHFKENIIFIMNS
jgi:hypothetical protein